MTPLAEITPTQDRCEDCESMVLDFEFSKNNLPKGIPEGMSSYTGCVQCDEFLNSLTTERCVTG